MRRSNGSETNFRTLVNNEPSIPDYAAIAEEIRGLESYLSSKIKGQHHAISRVCSVLERGQFGLNPIEKPLGLFLSLVLQVSVKSD